MKNAAGTPFPGGDLVIPGLTDTVMQFKVVGTKIALDSTNIAAGTPIRQPALQPILNAHNPATGSITRQLTLNEVIWRRWSPRIGFEQFQVQSQKLQSFGSSSTYPGSSGVHHAALP